MTLTCVSAFKAEGPDGQLHDFKPGQEISVAPEVEMYLLRCSPASFEKDAPARAREEPALVGDQGPEEVATVDAMSTETETGIVAPDRRARGGAKRSKK